MTAKKILPEGMRSVRIPFQGFYDSDYSDALDREDEYFLENCQENGEYAEIDPNDLSNALIYSMHSASAFRRVAKSYTETFGELVDEYLPGMASIEFEEMVSPKEYNFTTDRLFALLPSAMLQSWRDDAAIMDTFTDVVNEELSHRSGFISFYSNDVHTYLEKPFEEWDHNELSVLLTAAMRTKDVPDTLDDDILSRLIDSSIFSKAFDMSVDWADFDKRIKTLRDSHVA